MILSLKYDVPRFAESQFEESHFEKSQFEESHIAERRFNEWFGKTIHSVKRISGKWLNDGFVKYAVSLLLVGTGRKVNCGNVKSTAGNGYSITRPILPIRLSGL